MALSTKAVTVFATLEALRDNQPDIRYPLATLFEPDLAKFNDRLFDAQLLADEINSQYKLEISKEILEGFLPIFEQRKWVRRILHNGESAAYVVQCSLSPQMTGELNKFQSRAGHLAVEFRNFIDEISPLSQVKKSDSELIDLVVDFLLLLDRSGASDFRAATSHYKIGKKIALDVQDAGENGPLNEDTFLAARFLEHLFHSNSEHLPFLIELAEVGLITEVVRDFQKPSSAVKKTNLALYLDAPIAMDYLGLSGLAQRDNLKLVLGKFEAGGGVIRIFRESVSEMQGSLQALLARPLGLRTGPTADALRRREILEAFVRDVAARPDFYLQEVNVSIVEDDLDSFPNQHKYFSRDAYEHLYSQISWVREDAARHHDALIATLTSRRRSGARTSDLFESKHIVVTRNPSFPQLAKRISREHNFLGPYHVGPVVHLRELATAVWLRMGVQNKDEIPRSSILAACRRVLTVRKNLVEKVNEFKSTLTEAQAEQLEILMTSDKSTLVLMDKTLGSSNVIDASSMPLLLEEMKRAQIKEYASERDRQEREKEKLTKKREAILSSAADEAARVAELARTEANAQRAKLDSVYERVVLATNQRAAFERLAFITAMTLLLCFGTFLGFVSQGQDGLVAVLAAIVVGAIGALVYFVSAIQAWLIDPWFRSRDYKTLGRTAFKFGLSHDELSDHVEHDGFRFHLRQD